MISFIPVRGEMLSVVCGCLLYSLCGIGLAQAPPPPPDPSLAPGGPAAQTSSPTLKITAREVLIDVLAFDRAGQPVTGLKAADFKVTEEGEPQVVRKVEEHHAMPVADMDKLAAMPALPSNTFTNFTPVRNTNASIVLLLDAMDSPVGAQMQMRQQLINYLKHMQPGPPVAIFQLDTEMRLIQGFSSDPKVLLAAAESKRDMPSLAKPTAAPRSYTADAVYRRTLMDNLRNGMRMMGSYLSGFPGRKNLIWFTGQVPMTILGMGFGNPFRDGFTVSGGAGEEASELTDVLTVSRVAVYPVDTRGLVAPGPDPFATGPARGGMMIQTAHFYNHANMDEIADQTGGKAYYNTNDFTRVITDVVNTTSSYYTVAYSTTNGKWNGELRHIKISVDRPDVNLQHKQGYYAYSIDKKEQNGIAAIQRNANRPTAPTLQRGPDAQSANQPPAGSAPGAPDSDATIHHSANGGFGAAMGLGAIPPTEIVFVTRFEADANSEKLDKSAPAPPDNFLKPEWQHKPFRNYKVVFDADAHKIRVTQTPDGMRHGSVEFVAVVYAGDGRQVNSLINTESFDLNAEQYRKLLASGLPAKMVVAVPVKGSFFLRLGVHDVTGDQVGALEVPVDQIKLASTATSPAAH